VIQQECWQQEYWQYKRWIFAPTLRNCIAHILWIFQWFWLRVNLFTAYIYVSHPQIVHAMSVSTYLSLCLRCYAYTAMPIPLRLHCYAYIAMPTPLRLHCYAYIAMPPPLRLHCYAHTATPISTTYIRLYLLHQRRHPCEYQHN
jgi:hypothetical protein